MEMGRELGEAGRGWARLGEPACPETQVRPRVRAGAGGGAAAWLRSCSEGAGRWGGGGRGSWPRVTGEGADSGELPGPRPGARMRRSRPQSPAALTPKPTCFRSSGCQ